MAHIAIILSENNLSYIIIEEIVCRNTCFECNYNTVALVLMSFTTNTFPLGGMSFISWQTHSLQNPEENAAVPLCIAGLVLNSTGSPTCGVYKFGC